MLKLKRLHPEAKVPTRGYPTDAGLDLYSIGPVCLSPGKRVLVRTGIAIALPAGKVGLVKPRSGLAVKNGIDVMAGVIDASYRGEVMVLLINLSEYLFSLEAHTRIAQLVIQDVWTPDIMVVDELDTGERGEKGFGSTGL